MTNTKSSNFAITLKNALTPSEIKKITQKYFGLEDGILEGKSRRRIYVEPRQMSMSLICTYTSSSLKCVGSYFGNRDHSTVIHAKQTVEDLSSSDLNFRIHYNNLNELIKETIREKHKVKNTVYIQLRNAFRADLESRYPNGIPAYVETEDANIKSLYADLQSMIVPLAKICAKNKINFNSFVGEFLK